MTIDAPESFAPGPLESGDEFTWPYLERLPARLLAAGANAEVCRVALRESQSELKARFLAEEPVETLVHARSHVIDAVLLE